MAQRQTIEIRSSFTRSRIPVDLKKGRECILGDGSSGRGPALEGREILPEHARLLLRDDGVYVEPIGAAPVSVNGQPIGQPALLDDGDWFALGSTQFQMHFPDHHPATTTTSTVAPTGRGTGAAPAAVLLIGRAPQCQVQIESPLVSREHARLAAGPDGVTIEDLGSTNGTFVNGGRILEPTRLRQGDRVAFASFSFVFTGQTLETIDLSGRVRVEVRNLAKEVADRSTRQTRRLLDDISLVIEPGEFVVIFGTSGSGKSTLMDALNGRRPANRGQVLYNGADLYGAFDSFRSAIGYVPQQDIVHRKITVRRALEYTARLRLPGDTSDREIAEHITRVLDKVGLAEKADLAIDTPAPLSGGQLKRVSLAVELVANPNILFLDEVTSGLDAGTDKRMMRLFADLAADQKTVVCVTHTLENIDVCNLVVLLHKGKLVYYGPPGEAAAYFGLRRLSDVYELLESSPPDEWAERFLSSSHYRTYVLQRLSASQARPGETRPMTGYDIGKPRVRWFDAGQTATLMRRYLDLILSDRRNLLILLAQAPVIAVVIGLVFKTEGLPAARAAAESQITFILVLSAIWFGTLNAAREVVKELPVYLRERSVNLGITPYLVSKLVPLACLCLLQCVMLLGIVAAMVSLSGGFFPQLAGLFVAGMAATHMGLAVSAFVDTNDKAVAMAPILLIPQVILANAVVRLGDAGLWVAKCSMISYWALDAMKNTLSEGTRHVRDMMGELIVPVSAAYGMDLAMVAVLGLVFLAVAVVGLKLKDRRN